MDQGGEAVARYTVLDIVVDVRADAPAILEQIDASYGTFRTARSGTIAPDAIIEARRRGRGWEVSGGGEPPTRLDSPAAARLDVLDRLVTCIVRDSYGRGRLTIHAAALAGPAGAIILAGPSGHGKTTLALGLAKRGFGLLSDELAVLDGEGLVLPYRRGLHVRPSTTDLLPELGFLAAHTRHEMGGGSEWALSQREVDALWQGGLAGPTPLAAAVVLEGRPGAASAHLEPAPAAILSLDLLRGSFAASIDFPGALARLADCLGGVRCAHLQIGALEETLDLIVGWLGEPGPKARRPRPNAGLAA